MFFQPVSLSVKEVANSCGAELVNAEGNEELPISGASPIETAVTGNISFIDSKQTCTCSGNLCTSPSSARNNDGRDC